MFISTYVYGWLLRKNVLWHIGIKSLLASTCLSFIIGCMLIILMHWFIKFIKSKNYLNSQKIVYRRSLSREMLKEPTLNSQHWEFYKKKCCSSYGLRLYLGVLWFYFLSEELSLIILKKILEFFVSYKASSIIKNLTFIGNDWFLEWIQVVRKGRVSNDSQSNESINL